jgi:predicted nuclease of predicted toxin-antitoxin system
LRLKLDENLPRRLKRLLSNLEHDVTTVADEQLLSQPDAVVARAAMSEHRLLMTLDLQFGDLRRYPPGSHPGIILFRPRRFGLLNTARFVEEFVRASDLASLAGCVVVVEPSRVRVRWPSSSPPAPPE